MFIMSFIVTELHMQEDITVACKTYIELGFGFTEVPYLSTGVLSFSVTALCNWYAQNNKKTNPLKTLN